ncbi:hypothetical protein DSO57_1035769 [Entomophthora muscae]|uniref:Uncharacterized protein n=1 Tax=Entomophthora muscae TaxID=34485 RepID=A0ACC2TYW1_9FUNG|nr:hypothetical protein DSO57_1035769 [Entomophthora muscae]
MLTPTPRGNVRWSGYCSRGKGCNTACDSPKAKSPFNSIFSPKKIVKRGQNIRVEWLRQNHPGGFVRLAMVPFGRSDNRTLFDRSVVKYVCYETNCREDKHVPLLGKNNGPGYQKCSTTIKVPRNLRNGAVTLQWTWFGGGVYYANRRAAFANYVSCSDMVVKGGRFSRSRPRPSFKGGDAATRNKGQCRYWATNSVFGCPHGAEKKNSKCGISHPRYGPPKEWLRQQGKRRRHKS